jgi:pyruvate kinase
MRKTKIVATIGPVCDSEEKLVEMIEAGVNVFRFNMKHNVIEWHSERMERVERLCEKLDRRVAILMDLQGPEVRIEEVPENMGNLEPGDRFWLVKPGVKDGVSVDHPEVFDHLEVGGIVFADDGFLEFKVVKTESDRAQLEVVEGGVIKPRKTLNFPGASLDFPVLIERDLEQLSLAAKHHVDYVALSFVRTAEDIAVLRRELTRAELDCGIIAKIEHPDAVANFEEILAESDGIMVARGDLGIEFNMEEVPALQKMIIKRSREAGAPVIVATQMLESMIENPRPTRAEVSDVANAVYDRADAVMLSGETATGKYPVRAVATMATILRRTEEALEPEMVSLAYRNGGQTGAVVEAARRLVTAGWEGKKPVSQYVVLTETGRTARLLSRLRPQLPVLALSSDKKTLDRLCLSWAVQSVEHAFHKDALMEVKGVIEALKEKGLVASGETVVMVYGETWGTPGLTSVVRVQEVD